MKILPERTISSVFLLAALIVILVTLAVLQYQWSGQVSEAEHERMKSSLAASIGQFRQQFNLELQELAFTFDPGPAVVANRDWRSYAATCGDLLGRSQNRVVAHIYVWTFGDRSELLRLNPGAKVFESVAWPGALRSVKERYEGPSWGGRQQRLFPAVLGSEVPVLVRPMERFQPRPERVEGGQFAGFLIIELSPEAMRDTVFPELAQRYFAAPGGFAYRVGVIAQNPRRLIYVSDPSLPLGIFDTPDARTSLWMGGPRGGGPPPPPGFPFVPGGPPRDRVQYRGDPGPPPPADGLGWELVASHPRGSLEVAVATQRRRNLTVSFGVLLLLAGSMALIIVSARRAQRLAQLQMDFVAGVSHELRTPLAVISSAGDNLADGIVEGSPGQVRKYGELVRSEAGRLAGMVDQILQFGKLQRTRRKYDLQPAQLDDIARKALAALEPALRGAGFSVETAFAPGLPAVNVDPAALSICVRNLLQNAFKYSDDGKWISVRTATTRTRRGAAVELVIEDRGTGIEAEDLPHIFDAFYRGRKAKADQIHGAGLGLFMVREAVLSMGGTINVESKVASGTRFTVTLPASEA